MLLDSVLCFIQQFVSRMAEEEEEPVESDWDSSCLYVEQVCEEV